MSRETEQTWHRVSRKRSCNNSTGKRESSPHCSTSIKFNKDSKVPVESYKLNDVWSSCLVPRFLPLASFMMCVCFFLLSLIQLSCLSNSLSASVQTLWFTERIPHMFVAVPMLSHLFMLIFKHALRMSAFKPECVACTSTIIQIIYISITVDKVGQYQPKQKTAAVLPTINIARFMFFHLVVS